MIVSVEWLLFRKKFGSPQPRTEIKLPGVSLKDEREKKATA